MNLASGMSRSFVGKQFEQAKICSLCGCMFCKPKVKVDARVYQPLKKE